MASPIVNTRVEKVVEAIEDMMVSVASRDHDAVVVARKECADALREFLVPIVRVVTNNGERVG